MAVSYVVNYRVHGTTTWNTWTTTGATSTILGANPPGPPLATGTDYDVEIVAQNSFGSTTSAVASATTTAPVSITSINLSNQTFIAGQPVGTIVGSISVTLSTGSFTGTLALGGTNAADFEIVGTNLELASATIAAGTYAITITATQAGLSNSPLSQNFPAITASAAFTPGLVNANLGTVNAAQPAVSKYLANSSVGPYEFLPAGSTSFDSLANSGIQQNLAGLGFTLLRIHVGNEQTIMNETFPTSPGTSGQVWTQFDELFAALPNLVNLTNCRLILTGGVKPAWCDVTTSTGATQYGGLMAQIAARAVLRNCEIFYWEPHNEPDGGKVTSAQYAVLHLAVAQALKNYSTTNSRGYYNVGGPCIQEVPYSTWIANMVTTCVGAGVAVDFLSWHDYPTGSVGHFNRLAQLRHPRTSTRRYRPYRRHRSARRLILDPSNHPMLHDRMEHELRYQHQWRSMGTPILRRRLVRPVSLHHADPTVRCQRTNDGMVRSHRRW